jgi:hypothetical protein
MQTKVPGFDHPRLSGAFDPRSTSQPSIRFKAAYTYDTLTPPVRTYSQYQGAGAGNYYLTCISVDAKPKTVQMS